MAAQQLRQILRERRARQYHVAAHFMRLLLQVTLHVREEADDRSSLLQLALQLGDQRQGFGAGVVKVENDQRRLFLAVLLHALAEIFVALDELDFHVELARRFLNLGGEKQVVDKGKNTGVGVLLLRGQGFGIGLGERGGETGPLPAGLMAIAVHRGAIAVVHGRGVNAVLIVARLALAGTLPALILGTASAPPSAASSSTIGGSSWSCVHSPLKLLCNLVQASKKSPVRPAGNSASLAFLEPAFLNQRACMSNVAHFVKARPVHGNATHAD